MRSQYNEKQKAEGEKLVDLYFTSALSKFDCDILHMEKLMEYTKSQLALRNGTDRDEIWCAYKGKIYDVTKSRLWKNGKHYEHWAGQDLTEELKDAPHNENVFDKFKIVGILKA